ncbi:MAG: gluconate:H+ symporter [Pseudobacter sp.]|uniref:gluconate:H+ symporter n=1 Tax=Pseudobacter sp. TaxID=2045420 RepID=UPI003F7D5AE8
MELLVVFLAICLQIFLTYKKVSPFLSLLFVAILSGLFLGMEPMKIIASMEKGVGNTLGGLALIICLGAILGKILEISGAAERISVTLIRVFGQKNIQWAVLLTGFLIGLPLYYNAGFVILVPLVFSIARKAGLPLLYVAIPMAASLSTTHCFLPPHPSPVFLVRSFQADVGKTLVYGLMITIPVVIVAGPLLGGLMKRIKVNIQTFFLSEEKNTAKALPAAIPSFLIGLLPVILITVAVIAAGCMPDTILRKIILFAGDPTIALLLATSVAIWYFGIRNGKTMETVMKWLNEAIAGIAVILLIITAGGIFKQVLQDSGTDRYIASFSEKWQMPPLVFAWVITALLRVAIGSATVAGITAAGVVTPLVAAGGVSPELMVLAVGAGSVFGSHINDSGFWMFKEFFNLSLKQTFLSWTIMETTISITGLAGVLLLNLIIR